MSGVVPMARLQDVATLNPSLEAMPDDDEIVSFLPMSAVDAQVIDAADTETRPFSDVRKGYTPFVADDVLVAKITPCFENGKIAQAKPTRRLGFGSTEFHVIRPHANELDARFLVHFLRQEHIRKDGERKMTGSAGQRRVPEHFLANLSLPLPPLREQRWIAEILDKADALRAKRRVALAQLDILTQSIFLDMFGDPATNPKGMRKEPLGKLIKLRSGAFLPANEMASSGEYSVFGGNGVSGYHDTYMFEEPQIVIGRVGAYCGCVHVSPPKSWITDNALYVSDRDAALSFDYLVHALTHASLNRYASQFGQPLVSGSRIYPVEVLVPPEDLQRQFAAWIRRSDELAERHKSSCAAVDSLFGSLQQRAFDGEL